MNESKKAGMWPELCHLSMLVGMILPLGNILGPLVVWMMKRGTDPEVEYHGRESLNFQISMTLYGLFLIVLFFIPVGLSMINPSVEKMHFAMGAMALFLIPILLISLGSLVLVIIAAVRANGGIRYRYPLTIRFIKDPASKIAQDTAGVQQV